MPCDGTNLFEYDLRKSGSLECRDKEEHGNIDSGQLG
jgi:hypothetical protein